MILYSNLILFYNSTKFIFKKKKKKTFIIPWQEKREEFETMYNLGSERVSNLKTHDISFLDKDKDFVFDPSSHEVHNRVTFE